MAKDRALQEESGATAKRAGTPRQCRNTKRKEGPGPGGANITKSKKKGGWKSPKLKRKPREKIRIPPFF
jgi:hypothetical protein